MDCIYRSVRLFNFFRNVHFIKREDSVGRKGEALSGRNLSAEEDVRCKRTSPRAHFNIESNHPSLKKTSFQPENVVCTQKDNTTVKIIDFGTAKELEPGTAIKVLCGTPEFVAPEVIFV